MQPGIVAYVAFSHAFGAGRHMINENDMNSFFSIPVATAAWLIAVPSRGVAHDGDPANQTVLGVLP